MSTKPPLVLRSFYSKSTKCDKENVNREEYESNLTEITEHINSLPPNFDCQKFIKIPLRRTTSPRKFPQFPQFQPPRAITLPQLPLHLIDEDDEEVQMKKKSASCSNSLRSTKREKRGENFRSKEEKENAKTHLKGPKLLNSPATNFYCCIDYSAIPSHCINENINSPPVEYFKQGMTDSKGKTQSTLDDNRFLVEVMISKYFYISEVIDVAIKHLVKEEYRDQFTSCKLTRKDQELPNDRVICNYFKRRIPPMKIEVKTNLPTTTVRFNIEGTQPILSIKISPETTVLSTIFKILKEINDQYLHHLLGGKPYLYKLFVSEGARLGVRNCLKNDSFLLTEIGDNKYPLIFARSDEPTEDGKDCIILRVIDESAFQSEDISFNLNMTVKDALLKTLTFFPSESCDILGDYGLYYPATSSKNGYFLSPVSQLKSFKLKNNDVIELKKRHIKVPILLSNAQEIIYKSDHQTSVRDCLNWIGFNFHQRMENLALFVPNNGPMVNVNRSLLSAFISSSGFILKQRLEGLLIFFGDREKYVDVSFDVPFRDILQILFSQFGIDHHENLRYTFISLNSGAEVNPNESLLDQNIPSNSSLILKLNDEYHSSPIDTILSTEPIWNEKNTPKLSETSTVVHPIAGNLNQLIIYLTRVEKIHPSYISAFLMTYRTFTTPKLLFSKLVERFKCPLDEPHSSVISRRVIKFLKKWLEEYPQDFDHTLSQQIVDFVDDVLANRNRKTAIAFRKFILQRSCRIRLNFRAIPYYSSKLGMNNLFSLTSVLQFDDETIAVQLTLLDFKTYKLITPLELLGLPWNKEKTRHLSPNINALINRFNQLTMWVSTLIVHPMRRKDRAKRWSRLIKIATHLRKLNNYFSLTAFISGMTQCAVQRLKYTMKSKEIRNSMKQLQELESLMDASYSFKNYRAAISNLHSPGIICLSTELKDLTFIEEANPDFIDDGKLINFAKRMLLFECISKILYFQTYDYPQKEDENVSMYLRDIFYLEEKELYELSLKREPKGADKNSIL